MDRKISAGLFVIVLLFFFFPWVKLVVPGAFLTPVRITTFTGFQVLGGKSMQDGREFAGTLMMYIPLLVAIAGIGLSFMANRTARMAAVVSGVIAVLVFFWLRVPSHLGIYDTCEAAIKQVYQMFGEGGSAVNPAGRMVEFAQLKKALAEISKAIHYSAGFYLSLLFTIVGTGVNAFGLLTSGKSLPTLANARPASGNVFCTQCGTSNTAGDQFCNSCGSKLK